MYQAVLDLVPDLLATDSGAGNAPAQESMYLPDKGMICNGFEIRVKLAAKMLKIAWTLMKKKEPFNPDYLNIE